MPTEHKINVVKDTVKRFENSKGIYFTNYTGIDVKTITELRKSFRDSDVEYVVTKNTLTKRAAKEAGYENLDDILNGQIGIAFSEDPTAPARIINDFKKENKDLLEVLGLIFDGELYPSEKYKEFANLPSKEESLTKIAMMLNQPLTKFASALNNSFAKLLSTLENLKNTKN
jgi:large subunit ribosomal protein L10